jgi:hypothetical protein
MEIMRQQELERRKSRGTAILNNMAKLSDEPLSPEEITRDKKVRAQVRNYCTQHNLWFGQHETCPECKYMLHTQGRLDLHEEIRIKRGSYFKRVWAALRGR